jgi:hypothetical protein
MTRLQPLEAHRVTLVLAIVMSSGSLLACESPPPPQTPHQAKEKTMSESAKRRVPRVEPVESKGVRYEVIKAAKGRGFPQQGGVIAAIDTATGKELWALQVYTVAFDAQEEQDVQERYITSLAMSPDGQSLLVLAEGQRRCAVRLSDRSITPHP